MFSVETYYPFVQTGPGKTCCPPVQAELGGTRWLSVQAGMLSVHQLGLGLGRANNLRHLVFIFWVTLSKNAFIKYQEKNMVSR